MRNYCITYIEYCG